MMLGARSLQAGLVVLALAMLAGCNGDDPSSPGNQPGQCTATRGQQAFELINQERAAAQLPPLQVELRLVQAAEAHAADMGAHGFMSHTGSDGSSPLDRITATGYPVVSVGENVAMGTIYDAAEEVIAAWMSSTDGHREIILGASFTHVGIGHATSGFQPVVHYWCADFGSCSDGGQLPDGGCHP
jgi:uncharacterized protein YkwD